MFLIFIGIFWFSTTSPDTTGASYNPETDEITMYNLSDEDLISPLSDEAILAHEEFHRWQNTWIPQMKLIYRIGAIGTVLGFLLGLLTLEPKYFLAGGLIHLGTRGFIEIPAYWVTSLHYPNMNLVLGGFLYLLFPVVLLLFGMLANLCGYLATGDGTLLKPYVTRFFGLSIDSANKTTED